MPYAAPRPCRHPGCGKLTDKSYCGAHEQEHKNDRWASEHKKGNRHKRGYGREWEKRREQVLHRDEYLCQPCLRGEYGEPRVTVAKQVDHIIERRDGGVEDMVNLESICPACHRTKTARSLAKRRQH